MFTHQRFSNIVKSVPNFPKNKLVLIFKKNSMTIFFNIQSFLHHKYKHYKTILVQSSLLMTFLQNQKSCWECCGLTDLNKTKKQNKWLYDGRLCPENKVLHLMFYYELKLHWMKVCWLYERL